MLTLTEAQWQTLQQGEARQFVAAVCDEFLTNRPEMREQPGREHAGASRPGGDAEDREAREEEGVLDLVLPGEQLDHRLDRHQREPEGAEEGGDEEHAQQRANGCGHRWSQKSR